MYPYLMKKLRFSAPSLRFNSWREIRQKNYPQNETLSYSSFMNLSEIHNVSHCRNDEDS